MATAIFEKFSHPMFYVNDLNRAVVGFGAITYFATKDVDEAVKILTDRGVKVGTPKTEGESHRFVSFWDSEGNTLGLEQMR